MIEGALIFLAGLAIGYFYGASKGVMNVSVSEGKYEKYRDENGLLSRKVVHR